MTMGHFTHPPIIIFSNVNLVHMEINVGKYLIMQLDAMWSQFLSPVPRYLLLLVELFGL